MRRSDPWPSLPHCIYFLLSLFVHVAIVSSSSTASNISNIASCSKTVDVGSSDNTSAAVTGTGILSFFWVRNVVVSNVCIAAILND